MAHHALLESMTIAGGKNAQAAKGKQSDPKRETERWNIFVLILARESVNVQDFSSSLIDSHHLDSTCQWPSKEIQNKTHATTFRKENISWMHEGEIKGPSPA